MSINVYNIRGTYNIKDKNITFDENWFFQKKVNGVNLNFIFDTLTYLPKACPKCGVVHEDANIVKNGFKFCSIKLQSSGGNPVVLKLRKQRFLCRACNSSFMAKTDVVKENCNISVCAKNDILISFMEVSSFKDVANRFNVSSHTVIRVLRSMEEHFPLRSKDLPPVISMDEFKSVKNVSSAMSLCILIL